MKQVRLSWLELAVNLNPVLELACCVSCTSFSFPDRFLYWYQLVLDSDRALWNWKKKKKILHSSQGPLCRISFPLLMLRASHGETQSAGRITHVLRKPDSRSKHLEQLCQYVIGPSHRGDCCTQLTAFFRSGSCAHC